MGDRPVSRLILASGSASRRQMLTAAGLVFDVVPSAVDEAVAKRDLELRFGVGSASMELGRETARVLARAKALDVSARHPHAVVIGADQTLTLVLDDKSGRDTARSFDKPTSLVEARGQLIDMRGRTHVLCSAAALARNGAIIAQVDATAHLTMRDFSDAFLDDYLARVGDAVCTSVGAYQLEGPGLQLFAHIAGDYFTILGLPLLPLLDQLRHHGVIAA